MEFGFFSGEEDYEQDGIIFKILTTSLMQDEFVIETTLYDWV